MNAVDAPVQNSLKKERSLARIFFWPLMIGIVSGIGLIGALLEDGWWDALFCGLLAIPVLVGAAFGWRRN
jgi:predicted membrane protein